MVSPLKADSGQAWGRVGAVTSELSALRAIHRTAAATDTSSRSSDSKTAAIPVWALRGDCAGAGAPRAAGEGRGRRRGATVGPRGGGAGPGRRNFPRLRFGSGPESRPQLGPQAGWCGRCSARLWVRPGSACPAPRGDLRGLGVAAGEAEGRESGPTVKVNNSPERGPDCIFLDKHIIF